MTGTSDPVFTPIFHFQAHTLSIKSIDIAKRYLVTGSNDEHIRIYDLQKRKELGTLLSHQGTVTTLRFSKELGEDTDGHKSGKWLLSGSEDGRINIWRSKDWELFGTLKGHQGKVTDLDIHPSGKVAISVSSDHTIRLWNLMTAKKAAVLKIKGKDHLGQVSEIVRWAHDGDNFVVGLLNQYFLYDSEANLVKKFKTKATLMCLEIFVVGGKEFAVVGLGNGAIEFFEFSKLLKSEEQPEPDFVLRGHSNRVKGIALMCNSETHDVPYLTSVSSDGRIVVWNLSEDVRDQVAVFDSGERLNCVAVCGETVEKTETIKRLHGDMDKEAVSESEYETDGEEMRKVLEGSKRARKRRNKKKPKVTVSLE